MHRSHRLLKTMTGPRCSQDWNPPELVNGSKLEKETNDPLCLAESYRNLLKEYQSCIQDFPPLPLLPPPLQAQ